MIPDGKRFGKELLRELLAEKTQQTKTLSKESRMAKCKALTEPGP